MRTLLLLLLLELPAIIPLVLDHTPNQAGGGGESRKGAFAWLVTHTTKRERSCCCCCHCCCCFCFCCCCWMFFLWGCCPTLLPLLFFVDTFSRFARLDALSCVAVCQSQSQSRHVPSRPTATHPPTSSGGSTIPNGSSTVLLVFLRRVSGDQGGGESGLACSFVELWLCLCSSFFARKSKHTSRRAAHICMEFLKYVPRTGTGTDGDGSDGGNPTPVSRHSSAVLPIPFRFYFYAFLSLPLRGLACATDAAVATTGNFGVAPTTLCTFMVYIANTAALAAWQPGSPSVLWSRRPVCMFGGMAWHARAGTGTVCSSQAWLGVSRTLFLVRIK